MSDVSMTPAEVLAVMDWAIGFAEARSEDAAELREARAAVAALVAECDALRNVMREYDNKLAEVWGKEDNPYAFAYGWVRLRWEAALSGGVRND